MSLVRKSDLDAELPTVAELQQRVVEQATALCTLAVTSEATFKAFEDSVLPLIFAIGRTVVALFLAARQGRSQVPARVESAGRIFRSTLAQERSLNTRFGVVRYERTYLREVKAGERHGYYPLDIELGLTQDRITMGLLSVAVRLSLKLAFADARSTLSWFVPQAPSTEVIEQAVLGMGRHSAAWFESAPVAEGDGEVLVVMIDGKGAPTATESELAKRRGKRKRDQPAKCARHRGKGDRRRRGSKPRRKKGDKSKNARIATLVVMYTLKRKDGKLHGPINRWIYASFAPKRHAFAIAARQAARRGFGPETKKVVQLVTDGDNDYAQYAGELLPQAIHTIDVMHVVEKLWSAGESIHREGSDECKAWVAAQKERLYGGQAAEIVRELYARWDATPKTGPGNKGKRERLNAVATYLEKRVARMNYDELIEQDLEIGSGAVEGAVKNVIGKRCDHGGMRWIKERVEALLQLRCVEVNGDWERYTDFVHDRLRTQASDEARNVRLQTQTSAPLPTLGVAA